MRFAIDGRGWKAEVILSDDPGAGGFYHAMITTEGESQVIACRAAATLLHLFAGSREAFIREEAHAVSERAFDTKTESHRGFARMSFRTWPGQWTLVEKTADCLPGFNTIEEQAHAA